MQMRYRSGVLFSVIAGRTTNKNLCKELVEGRNLLIGENGTYLIVLLNGELEQLFLT